MVALRQEEVHLPKEAGPPSSVRDPPAQQGLHTRGTMESRARSAGVESWPSRPVRETKNDAYDQE